MVDLATLVADYGKLLEALAANDNAAIVTAGKSVEADGTKIGAYDFTKIGTSPLTTSLASMLSIRRWRRRPRPRGAPRFGEREPDVLGGEQQYQRDQHSKRVDVQHREPAGGQDGEDDNGLDPIGDEEPDHLACGRPEEFHANTGRRRTSITAS